MCPKCEACYESFIRLEEYEKGPKPKCDFCKPKVLLERAYFPKDTPTFEMHGIGLHRPGDEKRK